jgi:AcrR family transcriptional regulator
MAVEGLRERKKRKTKAAIQREALRLFRKKGYEETTVEEIAAAAEISPSTFFNYFPSKEDVVIYDEYDPQVFAGLIATPDEPLETSMRRIIATFGGVFEADHDAIFERAKLTLEVPELRARIWEELEKARDMFAAVIASRTGRDVGDFEVRVVAMVFVAAVFEAALEWVRRDGEGNMLGLFEKAIDAVGLYRLLDGLGAREPGKT